MIRRRNLPLITFQGRRGVSEEDEMLVTILIVVLLLMLVGALPRWNHSRTWGYFPSGGLGLVLVILIILLLVGRL